MKTIVVPTDFSPTAYNAARYAIGFAGQLNVTRIILYNAYQQFIADDPMMMGAIVQDTTELQKISEEGLAEMLTTLNGNFSSTAQVQTISDYNTVTNGILQVCSDNDAGLIVMVITGASG